MDQDIHNINPIERVIRLAFSITLALIPFSVDTPLGGFVLLPLLAIYPGITAALGWDPLLAAMTRIAHRAEETARDVSDHHPAAGGHGLAGHA